MTWLLVGIAGLRRGALIVREAIVRARSSVGLVSGSGTGGCNGSKIGRLRIIETRARAASLSLQKQQNVRSDLPCHRRE